MSNNRPWWHEDDYGHWRSWFPVAYIVLMTIAVTLVIAGIDPGVGLVLFLATFILGGVGAFKGKWRRNLS